MTLGRNGAILGLALAVACGGAPFQHPHNHLCDLLEVNGSWSEVNLELLHTDERECPFSPAINETITTGGTIREVDATYPNSDNEALDVTLTVFPTSNDCGSGTLGSSVGSAEQDFVWLDYDFDGDYDWVAQPAIQFHARTGSDNTHDCPNFSVNTLFGVANAKTRLNYFGEQFERR